MSSRPSRARARGPRRLPRPVVDRHAFTCQPLEERRLMATIAWDGGGADGDLINPVNWAGDVLPGPGDDAIIDPGAGAFIELNQGDSLTLRSLELNWPLAVTGTLSVTGSMRVGANFFDVSPQGTLFTNNLTLEAATGTVSNAGQWTIAGTSLIDRRIVSTGTLTLDSLSAITLGAGLSAPLQHGSIDSTAGALNIGDRARVVGTGAVTEIRVVGRLNIGEHTLLHDLALNADGTSPSSQVRVNFSEFGAATVSYSTVRFDHALITGHSTYYESDVTVASRAIFYAPTTFSNSTLDIDGSMLVQAAAAGVPVVIPTITITQSEITLGNGAVAGPGRLLGRVNIDSTLLVLEDEAILGGLVNFSGGTIQGAHGLATTGIVNAGAWTLAETTRLVVGSQSVLNLTTSTTGHTIDGSIRVDGAMVWTSGGMLMNGQITISDNAVFTARFADGVAPDMEGDGLFTNFGTFRASAGENELYIDPNFDNRGVVQAGNGTLRFRSNVYQLNTAGVLTAGEWIVRPAGILEFDEAPILWNNADITVHGDGAVADLASMTRNNGTITLRGAGDWADGSDHPVNFTNNGTITKAGNRTRAITGMIRQTVDGRLEVVSGRLILDTALFENRGTVAIGSTDDDLPRAGLLVTGDYTQTSAGTFEAHGIADGDASHLARFNVGGAMTLAGAVEITMTLAQPILNTYTWAIGTSARQRVGQFTTAVVIIGDEPGTLTYGPRRFAALIEA